MAYSVPQAEVDASPKITLGDIEFPIPQLAPRQQRVIVPKIMAMMPVLGRLFAVLDSPDPGALAALEVDPNLYGNVLDCVYTAMTRAKPDLKRDDFDDMPMTAKQVFASLQTIMLQTGMFEQKKAGAPAGEVKAGS